MTTLQVHHPPIVPRRARRRLRHVLLALGGLGLLGLLGVGSVAWYYAGQIYDGALKVDHTPAQPDLRVVSVDGSTIVLEPLAGNGDANATTAGIWGIECATGYARVGGIVSRDNALVTREFEANGCSLVPGDIVRLDSFAFPHEPSALGGETQVVRFPAPLGELAAWYRQGSGDTWIIAVHGKGSSPAEAIRLITTTTAMGYAALAISYRNDEGAPASTSGHFDYGATEWQDLEAAVQYAQSMGARRVVLAGYSMGGGIVMSYLAHASNTSAVAGIILDAPMLDFGATIDFAGSRRHLPQPVTSLAKVIAGRRYGVDWGALDYVKAASSLRVPVLIFHGEDDTIVPISTSEHLAKARPDLVRLERFAGATHVRAWNLDPGRYDAAVRAFLEGLPR